MDILATSTSFPPSPIQAMCSSISITILLNRLLLDLRTASSFLPFVQSSQVPLARPRPNMFACYLRVFALTLPSALIFVKCPVVSKTKEELGVRGLFAWLKAGPSSSNYSGSTLLCVELVSEFC